MLTYLPAPMNSGYNALPAPKASDRRSTNPDGSFTLEIWRGDSEAVPSNISIILINVNNEVILSNDD